jgi:hypothetical protein
MSAFKVNARVLQLSEQSTHHRTVIHRLASYTVGFEVSHSYLIVLFNVWTLFRYKKCKTVISKDDSIVDS